MNEQTTTDYAEAATNEITHRPLTPQPEQPPVRERQRERRGLAPNRLQRALAYIDEHILERIAVEDLAQAVHLSPFHFARMFRRSTGKSPHAYITHVRLERAKELLTTTQMPMREISRVVGYRNQAHFTRVFHALVGTTPRRFRLEQPVRQ
jgi:AraC family transcriptional regulator